MSDQTDDLDQADEEILTDTVSDEALEASAGTERINSFPAMACLSVGTVNCCPPH
jgi:hypothetical protein